MKALFQINETNKKQLPALVALSAVLVLAVGYSVVKSLSHSGARSTPKVASEQTSTKADRSRAADEQGHSLAGGPGSFVGDLPASYHFVGNPPRDPFAPAVRPDGNTAGTLKAPAQAARPGSVRSKIDRLRNMSAANNLRLPPMGLGPLPGGIGVEGPGPGPSQAPEGPKLAVTGIVRGSYDMAILRGEGGGRYFVREGQSVGDGYVVKSISPNMVVLKSNDRRVILELGGSHEAGPKARTGKVDR